MVGRVGARLRMLGGVVCLHTKDVGVTCVYYNIHHAAVNLWSCFIFISDTVTNIHTYKKKTWNLVHVILLFNCDFIFFILLNVNKLGYEFCLSSFDVIFPDPICSMYLVIY